MSTLTPHSNNLRYVTLSSEQEKIQFKVKKSKKRAVSSGEKSSEQSLPSQQQASDKAIGATPAMAPPSGNLQDQLDAIDKRESTLHKQ